MAESILLDDVVRQECLGLRGFSPEEIEIVLDTNALKFSYDSWNSEDLFDERLRYKVVVTAGVINEMRNRPSIFGRDAAEEIKRVLNPQEIIPFMSLDDRRLILQASLLAMKRKRKYGDKDIGCVDSQQIVYALDRARSHLPSVLLSDDGDILGSTRILRQWFPCAEQYMFAVSPTLYLRRKYLHLSEGLTNTLRESSLLEICSRYRRVVV